MKRRAVVLSLVAALLGSGCAKNEEAQAYWEGEVAEHLQPGVELQKVKEYYSLQTRFTRHGFFDKEYVLQHDAVFDPKKNQAYFWGVQDHATRGLGAFFSWRVTCYMTDAGVVDRCEIESWGTGP